MLVQLSFPYVKKTATFDTVVLVMLSCYSDCCCSRAAAVGARVAAAIAGDWTDKLVGVTSGVLAVLLL